MSDATPDDPGVCARFRNHADDEQDQLMPDESTRSEREQQTVDQMTNGIVQGEHRSLS